MKRKTVEVDVGSRRAKRAAGDPSALVRLPTLQKPTVAPSSGRERLRLDRQSRQPRGAVEWMSRLLAWSAALLALVACGTFFYYTVVVRLDRTQPPDMAPPPEREIGAEDGGGRAADTRMPSRLLPKDQEAIDLVGRALATRFVSRVDDFFRFDPALDPAEIVDFLESMERRHGLVVGLEVLEPVELAGKPVARVRVNYAQGHRQSSRLAMLVSVGKSEWKIDYEAFVARCEPAWKHLIEGEVEEALVRVELQLENGEGEEGLLFRLHSPELDPQDSFTVLCRYGSAQARALASLSYQQDERHKMTLVIRAAGNTGSRRLEIARVLAVDWVLFHPAYDLAFH